MKVVYIAGPYMGKQRLHDFREYAEIDANINRARTVAARLANEGVGFFCPHTHSAHFEVITPNVPPDYWYTLDLRLLEACDALLLIEGWEQSRGARKERQLALQASIPVFTDLEICLLWAKHEP